MRLAGHLREKCLASQSEGQPENGISLPSLSQPTPSLRSFFEESSLAAIDCSTELDLDQFVQCFPILQSPSRFFIQLPYSIVTFHVKVIKAFTGERSSDAYESSPHPIAGLSER